MHASFLDQIMLRTTIYDSQLIGNFDLMYRAELQRTDATLTSHLAYVVA